MQRSIEQRERAAKELHARIHELENTESNLNQSYSTLSLKVNILRYRLSPFSFDDFLIPIVLLLRRWVR